MRPVFAIRKKGTSRYLPAHKPGSTGFSHDEPVEGGGTLGPRLFCTYRSAVNALTAWRQGKFKVEVTRSYSPWPPGEPDDLVQLMPERVEGRNKAEMEIVMFDLVEREMGW